MSLPSELWRQIIRHAVHNPHLFYTTWDHEPNSGIWEGWEGWENFQHFPTGFEIGTKCSIVMVCRAWRDIGGEFLYESIRILSYRLGNEGRSLSGLVDVFDGSTSSRGGDPPSTTHGYGWWTKRIDCSLDRFSSVGVEHLFSLLERCHNLEIFTFLDHGTLPPSTLARLAHILQSRFSHSLRRFVLPVFENHPASEHHSLIPNVALTSLGICIYNPQVDFPLLSSFETITTLTISFQIRIFIHHPPLWYFPRLRSLGLTHMGSDDVPILRTFIDRHQSTLRCLYLHITDVVIDSLPLLLHGRPYLQSLVFDDQDLENTVRSVLRTEELLPLKGVNYLGILTLSVDESAERVRDSVETIFRKGIFPDLKVLRMLNEGNPISSNPHIWLDLLQTCRLHGTRLEDLHGKVLVVESDTFESALP